MYASNTKLGLTQKLVKCDVLNIRFSISFYSSLDVNNLLVLELSKQVCHLFI